jgi:hypothetical protein
MTGETRSDDNRLQARRMTRRSFALAFVGGIGIGFGLMPVMAADSYTESGTVTIEQVQIAFIGSGNLGGGTLSFGGRSYNFTVGGLGYGGFGVSKMEAVGTVYNLKNRADFEGAYAQARYGLVAGDVSTGELFLENSRGVALRLKAKRTGLALSLGGDAVYIKFD